MPLPVRWLHCDHTQCYYGAIFDVTDGSYAVYVTNMTDVWCDQGGRADLEKKLAAICLEDLPEDAWQAALEALSEVKATLDFTQDECRVKIAIDDDHVTFTLHKIDPGPFLWQWVEALLVSHEKLITRQNKLFDIISDKDFYIRNLEQAVLAQAQGDKLLRTMRDNYQDVASNMGRFDRYKWLKRQERQPQQSFELSMKTYRSPTKRKRNRAQWDGVPSLEYRPPSSEPESPSKRPRRQR